MYASLDVMGRIKVGVTIQGSKGHSERIQGKPSKSYWGVSMAFHVTFSLGKCTLVVAVKRLRIYELIILLGLYPFLVDPDHEVILLSCSCLRKTGVLLPPPCSHTCLHLDLTFAPSSIGGMDV